MRSVLCFGLLGAAAYLLGAIPTGYLAAKSRWIDIRKVGSGNIGATNVYRTMGRKWGIGVFAGDALKGFVPAFLFPIAARWWGCDGGPLLAVVCAAGAVAGHNWPVYLGFKGGKGVATSAGGLLGVAPAAGGIGLAVWVVFFLLTRYVSLASLAAAVGVSISGWFLYRREGLLLPVALTVLGVVLIVRHRSNIRRLWEGKELRAGGKGREGGRI